MMKTERYASGGETMKMLELFSGSKIMAETFQSHDWEVFTIDGNESLAPDLSCDILKLDVDRIIELFGRPDVIWASPPCTTFSVASIPHHWEKVAKDNYLPKTDACRTNIKLIEHTIKLITELEPTYWFIENPRGMIKHIPAIQELKPYRHLVTYCQYDEKRMKPTHIWSNAPIKFKDPCNYGDPCHPTTPRGSKIGTQGQKNNFERSKLPIELCEFITQFCLTQFEAGPKEKKAKLEDWL